MEFIYSGFEAMPRDEASRFPMSTRAATYILARNRTCLCQKDTQWPMSLTDAFVFDPFSVNQPLIDSLLLEPDSFEVYVAIGSSGGSGTISDPYLVNTATLFDQLMNSFAPYTIGADDLAQFFRLSCPTCRRPGVASQEVQKNGSITSISGERKNRNINQDGGCLDQD